MLFYEHAVRWIENYAQSIQSWYFFLNKSQYTECSRWSQDFIITERSKILSCVIKCYIIWLFKFNIYFIHDFQWHVPCLRHTDAHTHRNTQMLAGNMIPGIQEYFEFPSLSIVSVSFWYFSYAYPLTSFRVTMIFSRS